MNQDGPSLIIESQGPQIAEDVNFLTLWDMYETLIIHKCVQHLQHYCYIYHNSVAKSTQIYMYWVFNHPQPHNTQSLYCKSLFSYIQVHLDPKFFFK